MAMLAEPRRKQKVINLRAKNNAWSNDTNKFGQRMLEKMGWSSGKGLGANENGIVEHVVARYKNDERGLGFEDRNDQWTKHEDDFNSLLANLSNGDNKEEKLHSGVSLEVKSKKSKARVHYHKYTRGKDLTRYSEKDLANIFGKKSFKNNDKPDPALQNDTEIVEKKFTEKGSMEDYFKNKMDAMKSRNKCSQIVNESKDYEETDYGFTGFAGTTNDEDTEHSHQGFGFQSFSYDNTSEPAAKENASSVVDDSMFNEEKPKKSKKKKKSKNLAEEVVLDSENDYCESQIISEVKTNFDQTEETETEPRKKSKKKKYPCEEQEEPVKKKKPKKESLESQKIETEELVTEEIHVPKKKKKRKNKDA